MPLPTIRSFAKSCAILLLGREARPRRIVRGLASGYRIRVSPVDHLGYLLGASEPHLQRIIRRYVAAGDTVYDIGAYIGYVSLSLAKSVGPQRASHRIRTDPEKCAVPSRKHRGQSPHDGETVGNCSLGSVW